MEWIEINKVLKRIGKSVLESMKKEAGEVGKHFSVKIKDSIVLINMPEYAIYVDSGRKPGSMPPPKSLKKWSRSKGLNEYAVAKNIEKNGIKAKPFLYILEEVADEYEKQITEAGKNDIIIEINKNIK